ncbi:MAG: efflux RND transporter periplasmic adaptor subunit [Rhizobiaceae bacterium]|nr:efflux RND transporter periplasmic adaptor subunit [Rhizobiaceae bacterium]
MLKNRRSLVCGLVLLAAVLSACSDEKKETAASPRLVRVVVIDENKGGQTVELAGTVESQVEVGLGFRIGGRVIERLVNVGDTVKAGQIIARLDASDEENGLRAAEAALTAAESQLSEARLTYDRQRRLYERQVVALAAVDRAEQALNSAQAHVDSAQAQARIVHRRLEDTVLYADSLGVVTAVGVEAGEVAAAGRPIVQIARDEGKDAVFNVPAATIANSPPDPEVLVALSMSPGVTAQGRIREVAPRADAATGTFQVRVGLIDPPAEMRLGSTVTGQAHFGGVGGIEIPASALTRTEGAPAVWVVDPATNKVALRKIDIADFSPASVLVSDGLEVGELVVTAGVQALRPGQEVRLPGGVS